MEWFRMYSEFASDPKVQSMTEAMQRRLMMIFCLRCSNTLVTLQDDEIAFALRISEEELAETKALFLRKSFITDTWEIRKWDERQFVSDSSAQRVARHRARQKELADKAISGKRNVTVTPQIQNRTDTEQSRKEKQSADALTFDPLAELQSMQVDEQTAIDWLAHRKKKKADVSQTVIAGHAKEAQKAGLSLQDALAMACVRGWAGFKAEWVLEPARGSPPAKQSRHVGFDLIDYGEGVTQDGRIQ
jgi:hypothetical protein